MSVYFCAITFFAPASEGWAARDRAGGVVVGYSVEMTNPPHRSAVADRLSRFGTTIFTEMTRLAQQHDAVNLAQGFPDFDGPEFVKDAAIAAIRNGRGQYARMTGEPALNRAIAANWKRRAGIDVDPDTQVTVTSGCTEAIAATMLGLLNLGDRVVLFEPYYDSYRAAVEMAGAVPIFVTLRPPVVHASESSSRIVDRAFEFDEFELRRAFEQRPTASLVNTPHNPTGKVFTREELSLISSLCVEFGVVAITDEVYERLTYRADRPHISLAGLPGMSERTITLSSLGKTFSLTGWKIGWAIASPALSACVRAAHQFLTFATATPLQVGAAAALDDGETYVAELALDYATKRAFLAEALASMSMRVFMPEGTYFVMVDHSAVSARLGLTDDVAFCRYLTQTVRVAAIPPSVFYSEPSRGRSLARFAFCKKQATLDEAVKRLGVLRV